MAEYIDIGLGDLLESFNEGSGDISPKSYQYYKGLKERRIIINGEIDDELIEKAIIPLTEMDNDGTGKPIELILNTVGGNAFVGFALVDVIEKMKTPLTIRIIGMAASMGIYIAMAHYNNPNVKAVCSKYTVGLIHSGSVNLGEMNISHAKDYFKFNENFEHIIRKYIMSHSSLDEETYSAIERNECWMVAEEMLKYGMVSEIV